MIQIITLELAVSVGEISWDNWVDCLSGRVPPPEVNRDVVDWEAVGRRLVGRLELKMWVDGWFDEDEDGAIAPPSFRET